MFDFLKWPGRGQQTSAVHLPLFEFGCVLVAALVVFALSSLVGAHWYDLRFTLFFVSLLAVIGFTKIPAIGNTVARALNRIAIFLDRRGAFKSNPTEEAPKFALIRIVFGTLLIIRAFWLMYYMTSDDWGQLSVALPALASMVCALFVAAGFLTQIALVFLVLWQWQIGDDLLGTSTLGNDIAALLSLLLLFANAGAHLSVDGVLRQHNAAIGRCISSTYYRFGLPAESTLQIAKLLTLFGYWCICVYSLGIHLGEPAWMQGFAGPQLLSNNFMTRFGTEFAAFFSSSELAVQISRVALWGMLPWYLLLLPCVFIGGFARAYAIAWAVLFFGLSIIVLRLGWLAEFEFLFFAGLFWQKAFMGGPKTLQVAYDDRCNLCDRTVKFVKAVDLFNRVDLKPLSKNHQWLIEHGISPDDAQKDLYGIKIGSGRRASKGYDLYLMIAREVLLLLPFYPVLFVGRFLGGRGLYRLIADRRTKLFGVCELPTPKKEHTYKPSGFDTAASVASGDTIVTFFVHMVVLGAIYLTTIPTPFIFLSAPTAIQRTLATIAPLGDAAHVYGVTPIDVFNKTDLRMSENWFTISKVDAKQAEVLLPIFDVEGKRLQAHRSDRIYFGNTVRFRRGVIGTTSCELSKYRKSIEYLTRSVSDGRGQYVYRQYFQSLPAEAALIEGIFSIQPATVVCEKQFALP